jgi:hypothetical protein
VRLPPRPRMPAAPPAAVLMRHPSHAQEKTAERLAKSVKPGRTRLGMMEERRKDDRELANRFRFPDPEEGLPRFRDSSVPFFEGRGAASATATATATPDPASPSPTAAVTGGSVERRAYFVDEDEPLDAERAEIFRSYGQRTLRKPEAPLAVPAERAPPMPRERLQERCAPTHARARARRHEAC